MLFLCQVIMNWLICNVCLCRPVNGVKTYYVTSCFHLICERCISPSDSTCKKCGQKCAVIPCNSRAPEKVKNLFSDVKNRVISLKRAQDFQQMQRGKLMAYYGNLYKKYRQAKDSLVTNEKNVNILWHKYQDSKAAIKQRDEAIEILKRKLKAYEEHLAKYQNVGQGLHLNMDDGYTESLIGNKNRMNEYIRTATPKRVPLNVNSSVFVSPESIASKGSSRSGEGCSTPYVYWNSQTLDPPAYVTPKMFRTPATPRRYI